jgi:Txe/YoeB family toxin of Txe-Axe toxin-antitoxin module
MTYLYVPTVAAELEYWYKKDVKVKEKIDLVLAKLKVSECLMAS